MATCASSWRNGDVRRNCGLVPEGEACWLPPPRPNVERFQHIGRGGQAAVVDLLVRGMLAKWRRTLALRPGTGR
ncbi:hypothetical protein [Lacisediminimonas profundi]|uniref:hypothetical protein n=1 Tax=Lacisediminimonas profundi TaxID=2603856 RepID=UPI0019D5278E|nr:hypothetical protein [Lacisediminimonas profundi]